METVLPPTGRNARRFAKTLVPTLARRGLLVAAWLALGPAAALATPYATSLTNESGTVSFRLNESADNVKVVWNGGATTNDLGARSTGLHTVVLGVTGPFQVVVSRSGVAPWTLISTDTNSLLQFNSPRGVAVNLNPASPVFGRIVVANSSAGTTTSGRPIGDGLYLLNADQSDALGKGNTVSTGGLLFTSGVQQSSNPWHIEFGEDDFLYIGDFSTNTGALYQTDRDVSDGSGTNVLAFYGITNQSVHTTIASSPIVSGSLAAGNLTVWAIDGRFPGSGNFNRLFRWDVAAGPLPYAGVPVPLANPLLTSNPDVTTDLDRAPDGKFFMMQNRNAGNESGLVVVDTDGLTVLWRSLTESRSISNNPSAVDILRTSRAVKVAPDGLRVAIIRDDLQAWVIPLTNGIPDLSLREVVTAYSGLPTSFGRDICWDKAGNLYALSSGNQLLRVFSPGGSTVATTGSDGTFELIRPPSVSVTATDAVAAEQGQDTATFLITRSGDVSEALTVAFALTGTAINGTDYATNVLSTTIPAGAAEVTVTITPVDDTVAELTESVVLTLTSGAQYDIKAPVFAQADMVDNELPMVINLIPVRTNTYEGTPGIPLVFTIERRGDTNIDIFALTFSVSGTAASGADFAELVSPYFPAGLVTTNIILTPIDDFIYEGDETVTVSVVAGTEPYEPGAAATFHGVIRDNEFPPATELFADDFETDSSVNYSIRFGANNGLADYTAAFAYDYTAQGISPAPHTSSATTRGLFLQVNKGEGTALGSAGVNVYPLFDTFQGNYALRCDMFLSYGTPATGTEHAQLGLNHSGQFTNRVTQSADANNSTAGGDGFWVGIETDGSNNRDYTAYSYPTPTSLPTAITNRTAASLANVFTAPPYAVAGSPGNGLSNPKTWADVELSQFNGVVSLKVNGNLIYQFPNPAGVNAGTILLGMNDQFDSIGSADNFVVFDNVRVVRLDFVVTTITRSGDQVTVDFVSSLGALPAEFKLQTSTSLPGNWVADTGAVITQTPEGFRATTTATEAVKYFRVVR